MTGPINDEEGLRDPRALFIEKAYYQFSGVWQILRNVWAGGSRDRDGERKGGLSEMDTVEKRESVDRAREKDGSHSIPSFRAMPGYKTTEREFVEGRGAC